jgi:hypothetical protein
VGFRAPEPRAVIGARPGGPGLQGRGGRGSKEKGVLIRESSGNFIGGFRAHLERASPAGGESPERIGRPSYVKFTRLGRGRLGYPRDLGPERIERPSEQLRTLAADRAQEADQITAP